MLSTVVHVLSSRTCRSPELHRNPGHISESELERPAWKERDSHRYLHIQQRHPTLKFECAHGCLVPAGYRISWEEFNRTNTRVTHYLPNLTQEYRVTGLTALTTYTIQVAGMTSKGQGQLSSSTISSGVPPGQFILYCDCVVLGKNLSEDINRLNLLFESIKSRTAKWLNVTVRGP